MSTTKITLLGGTDKSGNNEPVKKLEICSGEIYSIVGFTGSGKSQLISDIEQLAQGDTITGRKLFLNDEAPDYGTRYNPDTKIIAQLSQTMNFALEMEVGNFLQLHAESRGLKTGEDFISEVIECANSLAGEYINKDDILTRLSGGQSRALMIADVARISNSPIILIDEIENAGIDRRKAMNMLTGSGKIVLLVTHDPQLALLGEKRIVMKNGGMSDILHRTEEETDSERILNELTSMLLKAQNKIRGGRHLSKEDILKMEIQL